MENATKASHTGKAVRLVVDFVLFSSLFLMVYLKKGWCAVKPEREKIYSLTKKDFVIETFRSGGPGGQHQNTRDTGVRIRHPASGAVGESRRHRSQLANRKEAFKSMLETKEFQLWHMRMLGRAAITREEIERAVDKEMRAENLLIEHGPFE